MSESLMLAIIPLRIGFGLRNTPEMSRAESMLAQGPRVLLCADRRTKSNLLLGLPESWHSEP